jgi:Flp pilus assembly protein TadD
VAAASSAKVQEGIDAIKQQDFAKAKVLLSEARGASPEDAQAAYYLGVALQSLGESADAEKEYAAALALDPKLPEASMNLSAIKLEANAPDQALEVVEQALKHTPKHPDLLMNRALALEAVGKKEEAVKAYGAALEARPDNLELRLAYADMLGATGQAARGVEELKKAETDDPKLLAAIANLFGRLKAPAECIGVLDRAIKAKASAELHVRRGVCRHEAGDDPGAKADYDAALKLEPNSAPAHYYLGMHLRTSNKKSALDHLKKASEIAKGQSLGKAADDAIAALSGKKK